MRKIWIVFAFAMIVSVPATAQPPADNLIVPGERISGVVLGMGLNEGIATAITVFGGSLSNAHDCTRAEDRDKDFRCIIRQWSSPEDLITVVAFLGPKGQEKVAAVATSRKNHKTEQGLTYGTPLSSFVGTYGEPQTGPKVPIGSNYHLFNTGESVKFFDWAWWSSKGLAVDYAKDKRDARVIAVFAPRP